MINQQPQTSEAQRQELNGCNKSSEANLVVIN